MTANSLGEILSKTVYRSVELIEGGPKKVLFVVLALMRVRLRWWAPCVLLGIVTRRRSLWLQS